MLVRSGLDAQALPNKRSTMKNFILLLEIDLHLSMVDAMVRIDDGTTENE